MQKPVAYTPIRSNTHPEGLDENARRRAELRETKPAPGSIVTAKNGFAIPVQYQLVPAEQLVASGGSDYILFVNLGVDEEATGWYLTTEDRGLKAMFKRDCHKQLLARNNGCVENLFIDAVRVHAHSRSGTSVVVGLVD